VIEISFSASERETVIQTDDESGKYKIYTLQQKVQTKLKRANILPYKTDTDGAMYFELDFNQISFRAKSDKPKRVMSDEHKDKLRKGREAKSRL
jgi:hypothetical protein